MDKKLYKFGMDWLNGVLPVADVKSVFDALESFSSHLRLDRWTLCVGRHNYSRGLMLDGQATFQIMYNPLSDEQNMVADMNHNNSGIFFSISGDGIRKLRSMGGKTTALHKLLCYLYRNGFRATRFDPYCDILDKDNKIVPLITEAFSYARREQIGEPFVVTRLHRTANNFKRFPVLDDNGVEWWNSQLGHHGSSVGMFRCYNKKIEVETGRLSRIYREGTRNLQKNEKFELSFAQKLFSEYGVKDYWYRLEYEMHKENAAICFNALFDSIYAQFPDKAKADVCLETVPLCFESIFYSAFNRVFSIGVANSTWQYHDGNHSVPDVWTDFAEELSATSEYLVEFGGGVPYIRCSLTRLDRNGERIKGHIYGVLESLRYKSFDERQRWWSEAKDCFYNNNRYNEARDELDELRITNQLRRSETESLSWHQSEFDLSVFETA